MATRNELLFNAIRKEIEDLRERIYTGEVENGSEDVDRELSVLAVKIWSEQSKLLHLKERGHVG